MILKDILSRDNNNIDIFRVFASFMVIYGHAYALLPTEGERDLVGVALGFDYSGSLAVKIFFFLSGLVVTNSLLEKNNVLIFVISRFFRIWPALIVVLLVSTFLLGPALTDQHLSEYFQNKIIYEYFYQGILMDVKFDLPGVFQKNAFHSINGSLWSIPFEVSAYFVLVATFLIGALRSKIFSILIFLLILMDPIFGNKLLFTWLPRNQEITLLAPCFAFGSLLAIYKENIKINGSVIAGSWILWFVFRDSAYNFYFLYFPIFVTVIYLASRRLIVKIKPPIDISYGVYLWGWPVQQVLAVVFFDCGILFNQLFSILASSILGFASWHLIEKRFIKIGSVLGRNI